MIDPLLNEQPDPLLILINKYEKLFKKELDIEIFFIVSNEDLSNKLTRYINKAINRKNPLTEKEKLIFRSGLVDAKV
jgi:hypothetical protein